MPVQHGERLGAVVAADAVAGADLARFRNGHETEADVSVAAVIAVLQQNVARAKQVVQHAARLIFEGPRITAEGCMKDAILTAKSAVSADAKRRLAWIVGKYL